jgi:hypothetical protein
MTHTTATQRGADGGDGLDGMVTFFDAVADDPEMTPDQKIHWLRITAADYLEKLEVAETLIEGHKMRYDALVETMRREGAKLEAAQHVVALVRELRDECHNGIGNDDLPLRLMLLFGALTDYAAADAHDAGGR